MNNFANLGKNLDLSCPWALYEQAIHPFCEERLCSWVVEPLNGWTNLAYIIIGVVIYMTIRKRGDHHLLPFSILAVLVGLGSFGLHATGTQLGSTMDLSAMYFLSSYLIMLQLQVIRPSAKRFFWVGFPALCIFSVVTFLYYKKSALPIFISEVSVWIFLCLCHLYMTRSKPAERLSLKFFVLNALVFAAAFFVWQLDVHKIWCDPQNHWINGHALWHLLNCNCYYLLYRFYSQFRELSS